MTETTMLEVDAGFNIELTDTNKVRIAVGLEGFEVPMDFSPSQAREIAADLLRAILDTRSSQQDSSAAIEEETNPAANIDLFIDGVIGKKVNPRLQISPTDRNVVKMTFFLNDFELPLCYSPEITRNIAEKLLATALQAEGG